MAGVVGSDYAVVLGAMQASLHSSTTKDQRTQVEALLSQLKESQVCMEIMLHILRVDCEAHNDYIRLLALTILSDWVKLWWNKINEGDQIIVKNSVLELLYGTIGRSPVRGLRTKLAVMISNIAIRSFPQLWPSFLEDMAGVVLASAATGNNTTIEQKEVAFMVIEFTSADSIDTDYCAAIPIERRQDILAGFRSKLPQLLSFSFQYLVQCSNEFVASLQGQSQTEGKLLAGLMTGILRMVASIAMFAKPEDILPAGLCCLLWPALPGQVTREAQQGLQ